MPPSSSFRLYGTMPLSVTARTMFVLSETAILMQADFRRTDANSSVRTPCRKAAAAERECCRCSRWLDQLTLCDNVCTKQPSECRHGKHQRETNISFLTCYNPVLDSCAWPSSSSSNKNDVRARPCCSKERLTILEGEVIWLGNHTCILC
jgi:hypothetical protein